jgi:hypothetical protein
MLPHSRRLRNLQFLENSPNMPSWNSGFSRLNVCLGSGILPGKPGPAEAGTPERRYLD